MKTVEKFLEFNGKKLLLVGVDGTFYIAIKPICEALGIHYKSQHEAIKKDKILNQLSSIQRTTGADKKTYSMLCIPEKYIYGWLFSIRSNSEELQNYKLQCYEVLYNHFHNLISGRINDLALVQRMKEEYKELHNQQLSDPKYQRLIELQTELRKTNASLKALDEQLISGQLTLFAS